MTLKISRILHAGYVFECAGRRIVFDPIFENPFSRNCHAFPAVRFDLEQIRALPVDAVFISHFHDDHCSFESLDLHLFLHYDLHGPLVLMLLGFFVAGAFLGVLALTPTVFRHRRETNKHKTTITTLQSSALQAQAQPQPDSVKPQ
jgi:putative membrane protein